MKTVLFTLEYPPFKGGVANYYGSLVRHWPSCAEGGSDAIDVLNNNDGRLWSGLLWPHWLPAMRALYREIAKNHADHIVVGHILPLGTAAYYVTKLTKTPYTVILHGMDFAYALRTARKRNMARKILAKAAHIICANSYTSDLVKDFVGNQNADRIKTVNPGIDVDELRIIPPQRDPAKAVANYEPACRTGRLRINELKKQYNLPGKVVLFSIGRLVKRKGFDKVIEAVPEVLKHVPNLHYFIAGDGPDKAYIHAGSAGIPNIHFLGKINDDAKWAWLGACDIFIMPSRRIGDDFEGFGIVYLEANLCGKPVIAGAGGGVGDAVRSAYSGLVVDPENTERIAGAIINLARDEDLRKRLGEQGRERAIKEFSWEKQINKIFRIISEPRIYDH